MSKPGVRLTLRLSVCAVVAFLAVRVMDFGWEGWAQRRTAEFSSAVAVADHTLVGNETLRVLAGIYGISVDAILKANPRVKGNKDMRPGMRIRIPYPCRTKPGEPTHEWKPRGGRPGWRYPAEPPLHFAGYAWQHGSATTPSLGRSRSSG